MLAVGLLSAAAQVVLLREYLALFLGNELIVGLALAVWLAAGGLGSLAGVRRPGRTRGPWLLLPACAVAAAVPLVRASRLLFEPGEAIPPLWIAAIIVSTAAPSALFAGYVFGALSSRHAGNGLYVAENGGNLAGSLLVYVAALLYAPNAVIIVAALCALILPLRRHLFALTALAVLCAGLMTTDHLSSGWKYAGEPQRIVYGREGELAWRTSPSDTSLFVNGVLYAADLERPTVEQAVHIPMAQRPNPRRVLVLFDQGHSAELADYPDVHVDRIAAEPALARPGDRSVPPERIHTDTAYDVILLGSGLPLTAATSRFYAQPFLRHMRTLLGDSGVLSFTLPFSRNYLSDTERRLYDVILATTRSVFEHVWVFPGEAFTFVASPQPLPRRIAPTVPTSYLAAFVLPSVTESRLAEANRIPAPEVPLNTTTRPVALSLGIQEWAQRYRWSLWGFGVVLATLFLAGIAALPWSAPALSIGTSGLTAGLTSVIYLLLYQASYGALYSRVSLLLMALTLGFAVGGYMGGHAEGRIRHLDLAIGLYAMGSVGCLVLVPYPPILLFLLAHSALGALCGLQFAVERSEHEGVRYAADLIGGVLGMSLGSTVLMPLVGAWWTIVSVGLVKVSIWGIRARIRAAEGAG